MHFLLAHKWLSGTLAAGVLLVLLVAWQVLYVMLHYTASVPAPHIPRTAEQFGTSGKPLTLVVMGDSTSIGQGADYGQSIARRSAEHLAKQSVVTLTNVGVSGARVADVRTKQLAAAASLKPDVVLLAVGANDVTHLTPLSSVRANMTAIITQLQAARSGVQIVLTGSPAMGSVPRFAPLTQWIAAARVRQVNGVLADVARQKQVLLLPLAVATAYAFKHSPGLYAADNFHPNAAGYALWQPIVNAGLDTVEHAGL